MVSVTLAIPEEVKRKMEKFSEINWSGLIRNTIIEKTNQLSWKEEMVKKIRSEESISEWAVQLQRTSRKNRIKELKREGLI